MSPYNISYNISFFFKLNKKFIFAFYLFVIYVQDCHLFKIKTLYSVKILVMCFFNHNSYSLFNN